jgi:hypothetical protein
LGDSTEIFAQEIESVRDIESVYVDSKSYQHCFTVISIRYVLQSAFAVLCHVIPFWESQQIRVPLFLSLVVGGGEKLDDVTKGMNL